MYLIDIDIPFTKPFVSEKIYWKIFHNSIISDYRRWRAFHHSSVVLDDRYRCLDLPPYYCLSVREQRRSKTTLLSTTNTTSSPFFIHAARPSSPAENRRKRRSLSLLRPRKLGVDGLNNKVITIYECSMQSSSLQRFRAACLWVVQVLTPLIIPYRICYWANNRSAAIRIDTYRGAQ